MIRELLICLDGSTRSLDALAPVAAIAEAADATLSVVTITAPEQDTWADRAWLDEVCRDAGVRPARRLVLPSEDVVGALTALAEPGVVLCLTSHGHAGLLDDALGSVAAGVVARSGEPVLIVGPRATAPARFDIVQVCVDGSPPGDAAVRAAATWVRQLDAVPWLVIVEPPDIGAALSDVVTSAALQGPIHTMRRAGLSPEWDTLHHDDVAEALADAAQKLEATIVVAGTHGHAGFRQAVLGSVAGGLVRRAGCPVLLVGPAVRGEEGDDDADA